MFFRSPLALLRVLPFLALLITDMSQLLVAVLAFSMMLPAADSSPPTSWKPTFTEPEDVQLTDSTVAILTHSSRAFDALGTTEQGVRKTVATMKKSRLPILYLHDQFNTNNPASKYLYDDWNPTAYVASDIGHIELNLSKVEHVICLGGYFEQCERSTVQDTIRLWHRDGRHHHLRITQVTDGTFTVGQHLNFDDPTEKQILDSYKTRLLSRNPRASMSVDHVISRISVPKNVTEFLTRQLPDVPPDVNVLMDVFGDITSLQIVTRDAPTLTFAYRKSDNFLDYQTPAVNFSQPAKFWRPLGTSEPGQMYGDGTFPLNSQLQQTPSLPVYSPYPPPVFRRLFR